MISISIEVNTYFNLGSVNCGHLFSVHNSTTIGILLHIYRTNVYLLECIYFIKQQQLRICTDFKYFFSSYGCSLAS